MPRRILIVDDVATNRVILRVKLTAARYTVMEADDGETALERARSEHPNLILMDVSMPGMCGLDVCRKLKSDPKTAKIPIVLFSAYPSQSTKLKALEAGAEEFMSKPLDEIALMARIRSLLRAQNISDELALRDDTTRALGLAEDSGKGFVVPGRIAMIARDKTTAEGWRTLLPPRQPYRVNVIDRDTALSNDPPHDLYVIAGDLSGPGVGDGIHLIPELRARPETRHAAIVVVLPEASRTQSAMALDLGATDIVVGDFDGEEMALRLSTHLRRKQDADTLRKRLAYGLQLAVTDPLTGLYNRRYALSHLARVREHAAESGRAFAVMMLDLDRFKRVNDTYGHAAGDAVLRTVAQRLQDNIRGVDLLARIGGEEFLAVLPDCDAEAATRAAERLRAVVEAAAIDLPCAPGETPAALVQTVSIGVVAVASQGELDQPRLFCSSEEDLLRHADQALYDAKSAGRNIVTVDEMAA